MNINYINNFQNIRKYSYSESLSNKVQVEQNSVNKASSKCLNNISFQALDLPVRNAIKSKIIRRTFVPTPEILIEEMIQKAGIVSGDRILEPSAGQGHIVEKIRSVFGNTVKVDAVEINPILRKSLEQRKINLVASNILDYKTKEKYDKIIMNPPFDQLRFSDHVMHCYNSLLKSGGTLVAIVPGEPFNLYRQGGLGALKRYINAGSYKNIFKELFELTNDKSKCLEFTELPKNTFKQSDVKASVATKLLVLKKP